MLLTFGGIDKAGHMWGGLNDVPAVPGGDAGHATWPRRPRSPTSRSAASSTSSRTDGLLDETLVVLTTDHAQLTQPSTTSASTSPAAGNFNWYYGQRRRRELPRSPQPEIQQLIDGTNGNVEMSMQDSAIRTWLNDRPSADAKVQAADVMATLGGVRAAYCRDGDHYVSCAGRRPASEWTTAECALAPAARPGDRRHRGRAATAPT